MIASDRPAFEKLHAREKCEACGHEGWCMKSPNTIWCMRQDVGAYTTITDKAGSPVYLHRRTGAPPPEPSRTEPRSNWSSVDTLACAYLYTMIATDFAQPVIPAVGLAADVARFGEHAEKVRAIESAFYLANPDRLAQRIADEGRTQDAKNAGILYPDGHDRAGQLVPWLKHRKLYAWRDGGQVRDLRGRALDKSTPKVLSLAGSREDRGAAASWYQHDQIAACGGHIRIAGGHEKADALLVAGLPCVGSNEGQASDAMIAALVDAGVILATLAVDGEDPKEGKQLSEGQRLGIAIGERLEAAGIAVRIAEPLRSPGEPKLDADTILRDHGPEALRDIDARAIPLSLYRRRLGIASPDHDPEQVKRLQEALRQARELQGLPSVMMEFDRSADFPKAAKPYVKAATFLYHQLKSSGKVEEDGFAPTSLSAIAENCAGSKDAAGDQLKRIVGLGVGIHKRVEERPHRYVDEHGVVTVESRRVLLIKVDHDPVDELRICAKYKKTEDPPTGEEKASWGGKRTPCPHCQSTRRRKVVSCADCGHEFSNTVTDIADALEGLRAERQPDEPRADAASVPPTPIVVSATDTTYPVAATGPMQVVEAGDDDEADDWDPYECNTTGCTRQPLPDKRWCDWHDPDRLARFGQRHPAPVADPTFVVEDDRDVAPVLPPYQPPVSAKTPEISYTVIQNPSPFIVHQAEPQGFSPVERPHSGPGCQRCGTQLYGKVSHCVVCRRILDGLPLHSHQRDPLMATTGDVAAGGGV